MFYINAYIPMYKSNNETKREKSVPNHNQLNSVMTRL